MFITSLSIIAAGVTSFYVGRLSVKPPVNHDTARIDYLAMTKQWLLFNDQQNAWAVMNTANKPIAARATVRDAIDAVRGPDRG